MSNRAGNSDIGWLRALNEQYDAMCAAYRAARTQPKTLEEALARLREVVDALRPHVGWALDPENQERVR